MRLPALVTVIVAWTAARAAADEPKPEDTVGTWRGKAIWKGCSVAGKGTVAVDVTFKDGVYQADLAGARDDLGTVSLVPRADGTAAGAANDLKVTWKAGKLTLATEAGCAATMTLARDASGIASCDRWYALATIESTCDAAGDTRTAHLDDAKGKAATWKKAKGKARTAAGDQCTKDATDLSASLTQNGCLPAAGGAALGGTGVPECDAYIATIQRYAQCPKVPVEAKQAIQQAIGQMAQGWAMLRDPAVSADARKAAADACKQAVDALKQSAAAMGCPL